MPKAASTAVDERVPSGVEQDAPDPALVREELRRILASRAFQASRRGKEFLEYVVGQKLDGHGGELKERLIGIELFGRKPDYSTGEDPVVRVQAGDVRHRLERYYTAPESRCNLIIQIPLGSYTPVFHVPPVVPVDVAEATSQQSAETLRPGVPAQPGQELFEPDALGVLPPEVSSADHTVPVAVLEEDGRPEKKPSGVESRAGFRAITSRHFLTAALFLILAGLAVWYFHHRAAPTSKGFWQPAAISSKPVLLCLPKPMVYRPSDKLFARYEQAHPKSPVTRESRQDKYLPLDPSEAIQWGDMVPSYNAGPGIGGVIAALHMSQLLTEEGIHFEVRFGDEASYADMRSSPVVIIGGMNTDWASQLTSGSHFILDQTVGAPGIHEVSDPKRIWTMEVSNGHTTRDYGLITRQLSGRAGQFFVEVAGISHYGTEAASELLLEKDSLSSVLRDAHIDLKQTNLQIVVSTDITNGRAGPPHVVAVSSW